MRLSPDDFRPNPYSRGWLCQLRPLPAAFPTEAPERVCCCDLSGAGARCFVNDRSYGPNASRRPPFLHWSMGTMLAWSSSSADSTTVSFTSSRGEAEERRAPFILDPNCFGFFEETSGGMASFVLNHEWLGFFPVIQEKRKRSGNGNGEHKTGIFPVWQVNDMRASLSSRMSLEAGEIDSIARARLLL